MRGLKEVEATLMARKILDIDSIEGSSRWPLLKHFKNQKDDDSEDHVYTKSTDELEAMTDSHFVLSGTNSEAVGPHKTKAPASSIPASKASLLPPSSQSRPMIVRTSTSKSSLATHQLKELAAVADKQEEKFKLSKHLTK
jgi:hypothetical protein